MRTRRLLATSVALLGALVMVAACSSEGRVQRDASGVGTVDLTAGTNTTTLDIDSFCGAVEVRNTSHDHQNTTCYILEDGVDVFSGPGRLGTSRSPLTVYRFEAETSPSNLLLGATDPGNARGVLGGERGTSKANGYQDPCPIDPTSKKATACLGRLTPNPFTGTAAMAFESGALSNSTENRLFVGSSTAPFSLDQVGAQPWVKNYWTYSGAPDSGCTNGLYLSCSIVTDVDRAIKGGYQRPVFRIASRPLVVRVVNSMTSDARPKYRLRPMFTPDALGLLVDPVGTSQLPTVDGKPQGIAPTETYSFGGYRVIEGASLWQGYFEVTDMNGGTTVTSTCQSCGSVVSITIAIDPSHKDEKTGALDPFSDSSCIVTSTRGTMSCDAPKASGSLDGLQIFTVNIKDF